jgi:hypothetical protein
MSMITAWNLGWEPFVRHRMQTATAKREEFQNVKSILFVRK